MLHKKPTHGSFLLCYAIQHPGKDTARQTSTVRVTVGSLENMKDCTKVRSSNRANLKDAAEGIKGIEKWKFWKDPWADCVVEQSPAQMVHFSKWYQMHYKWRTNIAKKFSAAYQLSQGWCKRSCYKISFLFAKGMTLSYGIAILHHQKQGECAYGHHLQSQKRRLIEISVPRVRYLVISQKHYLVYNQMLWGQKADEIFSN